MSVEQGSWISKAYKEAEDNSALNSVREVARLQRCGCYRCLGQIAQVYTLWAKWGKFSPSTRQSTSKALTIISK